MQNNLIPENIIKIQKKLATLQKDSRNYKTYQNIYYEKKSKFTY